MKKKILLVLFIVLGGLFLLCGTSKAATYSKTEYSIDIPSTYTVEETEDGINAYRNDNSATLTVISSEQDNSDFVISQEYLDYLIEGFKETYGSEFTLLYSQIIEQNCCKGLVMKFILSDTDGDLFFELYQYASDNYYYQIIFVTDQKAYLTSTEKSNIAKSFKIKDTVTNSNGIPFTDVPSNSWYYGAVKYVFANNMIKGNNDYTFAPNQTLTRAMLVTILHRMEGMPYQAGVSKFPDVQDTTAYYYVAVKWASANNIVSGYNNGNFGPNDPITREQLAVILNQYCKYKGKYKATTADLSTFNDGSKVSEYAKWGMNWAVGSGVITGNSETNTLNPQGTATRAEAASMLYKYCLNIK